MTVTNEITSLKMADKEEECTALLLNPKKYENAELISVPSICSPDWKVLLLLKFSWESLSRSGSLLRPDPTRSSEEWKKLNWVSGGGGTTRKLVWQLLTNCFWSFVPIIQSQLIFIEGQGIEFERWKNVINGLTLFPVVLIFLTLFLDMISNKL